MAERERTPRTGDVKSDGGAENAPPVPRAGQPWRNQFRARFKQELEAINGRHRAEEKRRTDEEAKAREQRPDHKSAEAPFSDIAWRGDEKTISAVGLALSGGGIRSSAICLGVLQALNHRDLIKRIDYLSTVSGGGYIGSSLTASMSQTGKFAFGEDLPADAAHASEIRDTRAVGHIRNYSNYLIPAGARDVLTGIAIVVRGLIANLSLTVPFLLALAALTILSNPARSCLYVANFFGVGVHSGLEQLDFVIVGVVAALIVLAVGLLHRKVSDVDRSELFYYLAGIALVMGVICYVAHFISVENFALTLAASLLGTALFFAWALWRSFLSQNDLQEFRGHLPTIGATYLVLAALIGFFEFQPFMIAQMFGVAEGGVDQAAGVVAGVAIGWIKSLAALAAPVAAVVTFFRQQVADLMKGAGASDLTSRLLAVVARVAVWIAGLAVPLLIWIGYLYLCYWGVANDKVLVASQRQCHVPDWDAPQPVPPKAAGGLTGKILFNSETQTLSADIRGREAEPPAKPDQVTPITHIPAWLRLAARPFGDVNAEELSRKAFSAGKIPYNNVNLPMAMLYVSAAILLFALSLILRPNANSLHRLYRDRLSKAFLFNPAPEAHSGQVARNQPSLDQGRDFPDLDTLKLGALCPKAADDKSYRLQAPYHLINAALNIQGSDYANRRGRNADFFLFSPLNVGSEATGYCDASVLDAELDLATAMAISGAAVSSNMGSSSIRALTPTLALLNVRLGYWLSNPRYVGTRSKPQHRSTPLFLWSEITGRLYENADAVYLTDGGHIENLGVYELLRRRCKVIIAVDAEADEPMNFSALMTLQRYARIDLGIIIDLPWEPIRARTRELMSRNSAKAAAPAPSAAPASPIEDYPHVAIGSIDYGAGEKGHFVYIKSSLTGDENDYIRDYARRHDSFPHETTGDQFFSEEQFEVYRALGFHMAHGFLSGQCKVVTGPGTAPSSVKFVAGGTDSIDAVRAALGLL